MSACCGVIGAKDSHAGNASHKPTIAHIVHDVREGDLSEPVGSLEFMVKNLDGQQIQEYIQEKNRKLEIAERLLREENTCQYRKLNKEGFEAALVAELSGKTDAIKEEYDKNIAANQAEEIANKAKEWNGSLGYLASEPTKDSKIGRKNIAITADKERKNKINQANNSLVNENKTHVSNVLVRELSSTYHTLETQYIRGLKACGDDAVCLGKRDIVWEDVQREDFFDHFTLAAYEKAVIAAQQISIILATEDIKKMAEKNATISPKAKAVADAVQKAKNELHKILNPTPVADLNTTGEENSSILNPDVKEDQNDQDPIVQ